MNNIIVLHKNLTKFRYKHGTYHEFNVNDSKPRRIHKASVRDRLVHHTIHRVLYPIYDKLFIFDLYSCRINKGTHKAIERFRKFANKCSKNNMKTCWVLKCDIRKFFENIDHKILIDILSQRITELDTMDLLTEVIRSFEVKPEKGLPLGNLTSQLFSNIYLDVFDKFVKHKLKAKYYIRYADDFVILHNDRKYLEQCLPNIKTFLSKKLKLQLHENKVFIKRLSSGIDFLGWVIFPKYQVLRTSTKRRMFRRIKESPKEATRQSYLGMLKHGNAYKLSKKLEILYEKARDKEI